LQGHEVITHKTYAINDDNTTVERTLPLKRAVAITKHWSQGMTLKLARVKLGKRENTFGLVKVELEDKKIF
jgi:hypothetical protein